MRGVLLFAFNSPTVDYFKMAVYTAKRANKYLNLPVSVVTDKNTDLSNYDYEFDNVIITQSDPSNTKEKNIWINKGRYQAYELSPYDETLLIDTDYLINSDKLLRIFDMYDDFMCHNETATIMAVNDPQEYLGHNMPQTLWATVILFKKTQFTKLVFDCMKMVQDNYSHYIKLYNPTVPSYRNDFALTIALRIVNGQHDNPKYYIPWKLYNVGQNTQVIRESDNSYLILYDKHTRNSVKKEYIQISDMDIHLIDKNNFMELMNE